MKIKNGQMILFLNTAEKLVEKKLPSTMYYAIDCNIKIFREFIESYQKAYEKAKDDPEELNTLVNREIEAAIQMIPKEDLILLDTSSKFDALTYDEYNAISFMIKG